MGVFFKNKKPLKQSSLAAGQLPFLPVLPLANCLQYSKFAGEHATVQSRGMFIKQAL